MFGTIDKKFVYICSLLFTSLLVVMLMMLKKFLEQDAQISELKAHIINQSHSIEKLSETFNSFKMAAESPETAVSGVEFLSSSYFYTLCGVCIFIGLTCIITVCFIASSSSGSSSASSEILRKVEDLESKISINTEKFDSLTSNIEGTCADIDTCRQEFDSLMENYAHLSRTTTENLVTLNNNYTLFRKNELIDVVKSISNTNTNMGTVLESFEELSTAFIGNTNAIYKYLEQFSVILNSNTTTISNMSKHIELLTSNPEFMTKVTTALVSNVEVIETAAGSGVV